MNTLITLLALLAATGFVVGLKMLSKPATARRGNAVSAAGMLAAVIGAILAAMQPAPLVGGVDGAATVGLDATAWIWLLGGLAFGALVGVPWARLVPMTRMPEAVAAFNGLGGLSSLLIAWSEAHVDATLGRVEPFAGSMQAAAAVIGAVTFTGSMIAFGKLAEKLPTGRVALPAQQAINIAVLVAILACTALYAAGIGGPWLFIVAMLLGLIALGPGLVLPIGGADMPVVISLLNSYSGIAVAAAGLAIGSPLLVLTGILVGASGLILTRVMCLAMNRSLFNVLFGSIGASTGPAAKGEAQQARIIPPDQAAYVLEASASVVFVPGYGMAVAQAQRAVRDLADLLEARGIEVSYAIHPVAGRMPGHMSVLLAEADVPYDKLIELDDINARMATIDTAVVIGANDTVNLDARDNPASPIAGMPIVEVDRARSVLVLKRSMKAGYAGVDNPLFFAQNTSMVLGDAKATIEALTAELKADA